MGGVRRTVLGITWTMSALAGETTALLGRPSQRSRVAIASAVAMLVVALVFLAAQVNVQGEMTATQSLLSGKGMALKMVKQMHHDHLKIPQNLLNQCGKDCAKFAPHIVVPPPVLAAAKPAAVAVQ